MVTSEGATDPLVDPPLPQLASADPHSSRDNQNSGDGDDGGKQPAATSGSKKRKDDSSKDKDKKPKKTRQTRTYQPSELAFACIGR